MFVHYVAQRGIHLCSTGGHVDLHLYLCVCVCFINDGMWQAFDVNSVNVSRDINDLSLRSLTLLSASTNANK